MTSSLPAQAAAPLPRERAGIDPMGSLLRHREDLLESIPSLAAQLKGLLQAADQVAREQRPPLSAAQLLQDHGIEAPLAERLLELLPLLLRPIAPAAPRPDTAGGREPGDGDPTDLVLGSGFNEEQKRRARALWQPLLPRFRSALPWLRSFECLQTPTGLIGRGEKGRRLIVCGGSDEALPHVIGIRGSEPENESCPARASLAGDGYQLELSAGASPSYATDLRRLVRALGAVAQVRPAGAGPSAEGGPRPVEHRRPAGWDSLSERGRSGRGG